MRKKKILMMLAALLLTAAVGARAQATYTLTVKDGTEDAANWSATPNPAREGQSVTVRYNGKKKVKRVTAVQKALRALSEATTSDYGKVVCAAGHLHYAKTAVPIGCTAVGILGKVTETGHGLILALNDAASQTWNTINGWTTETNYASTTLKLLPDDSARGSSLTSYTKLGDINVSNWCVAQKSDYDAIFTNLGSTTGDSDGKTYDANVNAFITTGVGGTAMSGDYWSATEVDDTRGWFFYSFNWDYRNKTVSDNVRPVLAF